MSLSQLLVTAAGVFLVAFLARFFFRARPGATAEVTTAGQEATVVVLGGYQPGVVRARTGLPLRLAFDRREDGECSSRVVFPELVSTGSSPRSPRRRSGLALTGRASSSSRAG